jgi:hypothetical protein
LKWGLLFKERSGQITTGHSPSTGEWLERAFTQLLTLSSTHTSTLTNPQLTRKSRVGSGKLLLALTSTVILGLWESCNSVFEQ